MSLDNTNTICVLTKYLFQDLIIESCPCQRSLIVAMAAI